jgi:hypothetical protein
MCAAGATSSLVSYCGHSKRCHVTGAITRAFFLLTLAATASAIGAQGTMVVSNSPFAPAAAAEKSGSAFAKAIACFRFEAVGGAVDVTDLRVTLFGTGSWPAELDPSNGVEVWLDDGNGSFAAASDTRIAFGPGASSPPLMALSPTVTVASGNSVDLWIVLNFLTTAGDNPGRTFGAEISTSSDVITTPAGVASLGSPTPISSMFSVVDFWVSLVSPSGGWIGHSLILSGSGFEMPFIVRIGNIPCDGTPTITNGGTHVTGLFAPSNSGQNPQQITVESGLLPPQVLSQTWEYFGTGGDADDQACSTSEAPNLDVLALIATILATIAAVRFVRARVRARD